MVGKSLSHYQSLEELDQGVTGIVYKAEDDSSNFRQRATEFNNFVQGRLRIIMARRSDKIVHPDSSIAINMTIFVAYSTERATVLQRSLSARPIELSLDNLIDELITNVSLYLKGGFA